MSPLMFLFVSGQLVLEVGCQIVRGHARDVRRSFKPEFSEERSDGRFKLLEPHEHAVILSRTELNRIIFTFNPG
jgi:hypothetical protein